MAELVLFSAYPKNVLQILGHGALLGGIFGTKFKYSLKYLKCPLDFRAWPTLWGGILGTKFCYERFWCGNRRASWEYEIRNVTHVACIFFCVHYT